MFLWNLLCSGKKAIADASTSCRNGEKQQYHEQQQYGVTTLTGFKPNLKEWINQDSYVVHEESQALKHGKHIYAVFDGHGQYGHEISRLCRENLLDIISKSNGCFVTTFHKLHEALLGSDDFDVETSGTTGTIVVIHQGTLHVSNVGDSKAMIGTNVKTTLGFGFDVKPLTFDHTPDKEDEVNRIIAHGGKVCSKAFKDGSENAIAQGPLRVWYKYYNARGDDDNKNNNAKLGYVNMMGLAMTRSLGDSGAHKVGVIHEPHVYSNVITEMDEFIIVASDGIWDMLAYEEAASLIQEYILSLPPIQSKHEWDPKEAAAILVSMARRRWHSASHIDDITCCVIKLKNSNKPCFTHDSK